MRKIRIIIIGGFLGAGKTTLLWNVAQNLIRKGLRVGLITNDQAPELVDSTLLALNGLKVSEVSGSCFCCNFNAFTKAITDMNTEMAPDVILAEPVGSCTDLSATIMQPLKKYWGAQITLSPLTVLVDPDRLTSILTGGDGGLHKDASYILRKQLEESDIILLNKVDKLTDAELRCLKERTVQVYPNGMVLAISALQNRGVEEWLHTAMTSKEIGKQLVPVDYDVYANGEAVLGWLNGTVRITGAETDWDCFVKIFLTELSKEFDARKWSVGHVKAIANKQRFTVNKLQSVLTKNANFVVGNLTGSIQTLSIRGSVGSCESINLTINARVETLPEELDKVVREALCAVTQKKYNVEELAWKTLQPGRPEPTHRFCEVI